MKKKIAVIVAAALLLLCLAVTLASCSPKEDGGTRLGASVKKILEADHKGFEVYSTGPISTIMEDKLHGNYVTGDFDAVSVHKPVYAYDSQYFRQTYLRNGKLFSRSGTEYYTDEETEVSYYDNGIFNFYGIFNLNFEAAKLGLASMLNVYEKLYASEVPKDGLWTTKVVFSASNFADFIYDNREDMGFLEVLHNSKYIKYFSEPLTQEQMKQLMSALALTGTSEITRVFAESVIENGTLKEGQSAYDYLMGALDAKFADVDKSFGDYIKSLEDVDEGVFWDNIASLDIKEFCSLFVRCLYNSIGELYGDFWRSGAGNYEFTFDDSGELVGVSILNESTNEETQKLIFSDTTFTLEDIDDEKVMVVYEYGYDVNDESIKVYRDTVKNFAYKPEEVYHFETKSYNKFYDLMRELDQLMYYHEDDYTIEYKIDGKIVASTYIADKSDSDNIDIYYIEGEDGYFGKVENEWKIFKYTKDRCWKKVQSETVPNVYSIDIYAALRSLDRISYYYYGKWENDTFEFEYDGVRCMLASDHSLSYVNKDGKTVKLEYSRNAILNDKSVRDIDSNVEDAPAKPDKETLEAIFKASIDTKSVTFNDQTYSNNCFDFENQTAFYHNVYYSVDPESGKLLEYSLEGGGYITKESEKTIEELFANPIKKLENVDYDAIEYDPFEEVFSIKIGGKAYTFGIEDGYINYLSESNGATYTFRDYDKTNIVLPKSRLSNEQLREALKKTFKASAYEATRHFENGGITIVEQFDHKNQLTSAKWSNSQNTEILNILRAVTEGKVWLYSDASGQWLRSELDFEPSTYIDSASELISFKNDIESRYPSGNYTFNWNENTDEYTFTDNSFNCVITFKDGYLATLGLKSGGDTVLEFSKYDEISLALPTLGHANETARAAFKKAIENSVNAKNFTMELLAKELPIPLLSTDIVKGEKYLTTQYSMVPKSDGYEKVALAQVYSEWNNGTTTSWMRIAHTIEQPPYVNGWESWEKQGSASEPEASHKFNLLYYNFAETMTAGLPADALFVMSKYDDQTEEYIVMSYDLADMHIVENRVKIQDGYISDVILTDPDILKQFGDDLGSISSLTMHYSKYNETTLTRPEGVR